ncbi:MAG: hypothetical protein ACI9CF_001812 [Candidatus Omnitrophota bacterium]|jgi:hypothetical protein
MLTYRWDPKKNEKLLAERDISFDEIIERINAGYLLDIIPGAKDYKHQNQLIVNVEQYVYIIPFVRSNDEIFLKTIIPSRKLTKIYLQI